MAKKLKIFVLVFAVALSLGLLAACAPNEYTLKYAAGEGGSVTGETEQVVKEGEDGSTVTAVADFGYKFVKWSDGVTTAERADREVSGDITVTAEFEFDNMTVMNHLVNQMREKCFDFTMASLDKQGDIFIGSSEIANESHRLRNETYTALELLEGICDKNELMINTIYEYEITWGEFTYNGKLQCKYYSGDSYRIYLTLESEEALLPNPQDKLIFVIYIKINQNFAINYLDYVFLYMHNEIVIIEPQVIGPYAGRFDFNDTSLMLGNIQCDKQELINYAAKFISDISTLIDKNVVTSQLNFNVENYYWSYWINTGEGYNLAIENNDRQYTFENAFGGAFFYGQAPTITCVPDEGYRFVRWSDGVTSPTRTDVKPTDGNRLTLYAIVEKIN